MKRVRITPEPARFRAWREARPDASWKEFKDEEHGTGHVYEELRDAIFQAQGNLCAYCEIRLVPPLHAEVEHFHPKSDHSTPHNWALDFDNLLGGCKGAPDLHCGPKKDQYVLDGVILDPRQIRRDPSIWTVDEQGEIEADEDACARAGVDPDRARRTLDELGLRVNSLRRQRASAREEAGRLFADFIEGGRSGTDALRAVCDELLAPAPNGNLTPFWTMIRCFLGNVGEAWLAEHPNAW